jgi:hypothetical protein
MSNPAYIRLQNSKQYSAYKKRIPKTHVSSSRRCQTSPNLPGNLGALAGDANHDENLEYFEAPVTKREWWRVTLKETPVPGRYEYQDFLHDSKNKKLDASFKAEGRQKTRGKMAGDKLLPGAYEFRDFIEDIRKRPCTFSFKSNGRSSQLAWERQRYETDNFPVPGQYETTDPPVGTQTVASSMFKSKTPRLTNAFCFEDGHPPPGNYNPISAKPGRYGAKSSFVSKTPRFRTSGTNVPGPGSYETDKYDRYLGMSIGQKRLY